MFLLNLLRRLLFTVFTLIVVLAGAAYWWANQPVSMTQTPVDFRVLPGSSVRQVVTQIHQAGVTVQPDLLRLSIRFMGFATHIKAGTYTLNEGDTPSTILEKLRTGDVSLVELRFPEGWSFKQWRQYLASQAGIEQTLAKVPNDEVLSKLGLSSVSAQLPEGLFFPDTYKVDKGASDVEVFLKAYRSQQSKLAEAWQKREDNLPYKTPYEALIMASIVEKETGKPEDRKKVAAVFVNRMRLGMRLQTDPTVIYGLGDRFDGNLRKVDLLTDTPYNTYTRAGLPPTPIAMPGTASIDAALHPAKESFIFFVARGDGSSEFTNTLAEHNTAVARYQLKR